MSASPPCRSRRTELGRPQSCAVGNWMLIRVLQVETLNLLCMGALSRGWVLCYLEHLAWWCAERRVQSKTLVLVWGPNERHLIWRDL